MIESYREAASLFQALADPTRLELIQQIAVSDCCASDLHTALGMSQPRIARHLKILVDAGLVVARRDGRFVRYVITRDTAEGGVLQAAQALLLAVPGRERRASNRGGGGSISATITPAAERTATPAAPADEPPREVLEDFLL